MIKTYHYMFLSPTPANRAMIEMLIVQNCSVTTIEQGIAVRMPEGTTQVKKQKYESINAEGIEMSGEHMVFKLPSGLQLRYMRRVTKEPVSQNDFLVKRESKVVVNIRQYQSV